MSGLVLLLLLDVRACEGFSCVVTLVDVGLLLLDVRACVVTLVRCQGL
jgi:hypothetical protein